MAISLHGQRLRRFACIGLAVLLAACAGVQDKAVSISKGPLVWPQPPDLPRFAYETVLRSQADIAAPEPDKDKFMRELAGIPGVSERPVFEKPAAIAVDDEGNVYVTDASFNNFQIFQPDGQLLLAVGQGSGVSNPGKFGLLSGIAADETGRVYVVDQLFNKVEVFRRLSEREGRTLLQQ